MKIFGFTITRQKAAIAPMTVASDWSLTTQSPTGRGWFSIFESSAGAFQRGMHSTPTGIVSFSTVWACMTLIASDIAKMCVDLVEEDADGIWNETDSPSFSPVLRKPNHYQTRIQFFMSWVTSKLASGNTYILKERDGKGNVVAMYVLDPSRCRPLVSPSGDVYYALSSDTLAGQPGGVTVPAREIIHDVMNPLYHPLVGVSPLMACWLAATQGLKIQETSASFFNNGSSPGGILTTPTPIGPDKVAEIQKNWEENYGGVDNIGKVAVLAGGLEYKPMMMAARDAQLADQLKLSSEMVCSAFHVPGYMVGVGPAPLNNNVEALAQQYYAQCLQILIESIELLLDEGLALPDKYGIEFDLDGLLRMDTATMVKAEAEAVGAGIKKINESRKRMNLPPVVGGNTPYLQVQNYSLAALAKRDAASPPVPPTATQTPPTDVPEKDGTDELIVKYFEALHAA